jgi:hypothetical protein
MEGERMSLFGLLLGGALLQGSSDPCLANTDTVRAFRQQVVEAFAYLDTVRLRALGLGSKATNVDWVSDSAVCVRALDALHAFEAAGSRPQNTAGVYVFSIDSTVYVIKLPGDVHTFLYYDRAWRGLGISAALE